MSWQKISLIGNILYDEQIAMTLDIYTPDITILRAHFDYHFTIYIAPVD